MANYKCRAAGQVELQMQTQKASIIDMNEAGSSGFASLSQICGSNSSKVVHDPIMNESICELYVLQNCHITSEDFRLN